MSKPVGVKTQWRKVGDEHRLEFIFFHDDGKQSATYITEEMMKNGFLLRDFFRRTFTWIGMEVHDG